MFAEHTHIPVSRETPYPRGGELPQQYWHTHDPFVALATVAQATERLRVGTGICLVVERDPITTAKEVASLDALSGGRFEFGVGAGWNREEMRNHGTDPRRALLDHARARAGDEGDLDAGRGGVPRRARRLRPDLVVAEAGPEAAPAGHPRRPRREGARPRARLRRRVDAEPRPSPAELKPRIAELRERAGRHVPVTYYGAARRGRVRRGRCADAGVDRALLQLPAGGADTVLPLVERYAELAARHR